MKTTPVASGAPAVSPKKQRAAAAAAPTPAPAPAALLPAAAAGAVAAATAPAVGRSSKKKRRGVHPDAPPPSPPPAGPSASSPAAAEATPAAPAAAVEAGGPPPAKKARTVTRRGSAARSAARAAGVAATAAGSDAAGGGGGGEPQPAAAGAAGGGGTAAATAAAPTIAATPAVASAAAATAATAASPAGEGAAKPRGRGGKRHLAAKERRAAAKVRDAAAAAAAAARRRAGGGDDLADNLDLPTAGAAADAAAAAAGAARKAARKAAKKANPTPGRVARAAAHVAERASVDGPLFTDPAEFLRAAHSRWARNQLPGSEPPSKEVAAVGRLPADRVAVVPTPVALTDVAAVVDVRYPAMRAAQKARHRAAAKVPPTAAAVKLLVLTQSAVKSTEFGRQLRPLTAAGVDPPPAVAKLFSKHIKLEENVATLEAAAASTLAHVPLAVGTPARVLALLKAGALALLRSTLVVVDVSRDVKERMVVDSPDTGDAFMRILGRHLAPSGCSLFLFRDRGVEAEKQAAAGKAKGQ